MRIALRWPLAFFFALLIATSRADAGGLDISAPHPLQPATATLAEVLAHNAKAIGSPTVPETSRVEEWTRRTGQLDEVVRRVKRGDDEKTTTTIGPIVRQSGVNRGVRWRQDVNGITTIQAGIHRERELTKAALDAATQGRMDGSVKLLGESTSPVVADVVQVDALGGRRTWFFFDKDTGLVVRTEEIFPTTRLTTTYSEFRAVNGITTAGEIHQSDGDPHDDTAQKLRVLAINAPVPESDLEAPGNRRELVEFPAGTTSVKLPATIHKDSGAIIVRVTINGRGYDLQLDSGASGIFLDDGVVGEQHLARYGSFERGQGGKIFTGYAIVPEMHVGDLMMRDVVVQAFPFESQEGEARIVGLIGYDFIASIGLQVNFDTSTLTAYPLGTMTLPQHGFTLPIKLDDGVPMVDVTIGQTESDRFVLDTGAADVLIFGDFARKHPDDVADQGLGSQLHDRVPFSLRETASGTIEVVPTQLKRVIFGTNFDEYLGFVVPPDSGFAFEDVDGLIGYHFLRFYNLYFDYFHGEIMLAPNGLYRAEEHHR